MSISEIDGLITIPLESKIEFKEIAPLTFKKLHPDATPFSYNHSNDACMDMYALEEVVIKRGETVIVKTGIAVQLPEGFEGQVRGRSGLATKGLIVHLGTVDEGYRGDIGVIITNIGYNETTSGNFRIEKGHRIGQFSIHKVHHIKLYECKELTNSSRGTNGYGSSGV